MNFGVAKGLLSADLLSLFAEALAIYLEARMHCYNDQNPV